MRLDIKHIAVAVSMVTIGCLFTINTAVAKNTLKKIKDEGVIAVGVKADYFPFGFRDPSGEIVGIEIDMAKDIAERLNVDLELVATQSSNRTIYMNRGRIDLILATMSETPARAKAVGMIRPHYYAGGTSVLALKSKNFEKWSDLEGKTVCGTQGAYYNRWAAENYNVDILAFGTVPQGKEALLQGRCVAFMQDSSVTQATLAAGGDKWSGYETPLPIVNRQEWAIAVPKGEVDGPYGQFIRKTIIDWHRSGWLIDLHKEWNMKPTPFLKEMHQKYSEK